MKEKDRKDWGRAKKMTYLRLSKVFLFEKKM